MSGQPEPSEADEMEAAWDYSRMRWAEALHTVVNENAILKSQLSIAREALKKIENECDPNDPEWHLPADGRLYGFQISNCALKITEAP